MIVSRQKRPVCDISIETVTGASPTYRPLTWIRAPGGTEMIRTSFRVRSTGVWDAHPMTARRVEAVREGRKLRKNRSTRCIGVALSEKTAFRLAFCLWDFGNRLPRLRGSSDWRAAEVALKLPGVARTTPRRFPSCFQGDIVPARERPLPLKP